MQQLTHIFNTLSQKLKIIRNFILFKIAKNSVLLDRINRRIKPSMWRITGCTVGKNVSIGYDVYFDVHNSNYISIEDDVWIANRVTIFCHKRDMSGYFEGSRYNDLPYLKFPVRLKKGCVVGIGSIILPGVTIGEGSIVGAGSLVTTSIPDWSIAVGNPARVVQKINKKEGT